MAKNKAYQFGNYQIRPYPNELCWEIFQYRDVSIKKDAKKTGETEKRWVSISCYPSTFQRALQIVYEHQLKDGDGITVGLKDTIKRVDDLYNDLYKSVPDVPLD